MAYEIGIRIRKYREAKKMSQRKFAEMIGVSSSRVSNWEQGINRPDVDYFAAICKALQVSPSELLDIQLLEEELTAQEHGVIEAYRKHTDLQRAVNILLGIEKV